MINLTLTLGTRPIKIIFNLVSIHVFAVLGITW